MEDFGQMLRRLRIARGLSLRQFAKIAGIDYGYVGQIERGERRCSAEWAEICDQTLDADGALVDHYRATTRTAGGKDKIDVRRRALVESMGALAIATAAPAVALEALRHSLNYAASPDHDQWQAIADGYVNTYYTTSTGSILERLTIDLAVLERQMAASPDDVDLHRATAKLSTIVAMALTTDGQTWLARRWWDTARAAADRSGDLGIRVMARSQNATKGLYDGRSLSVVLSLAGETMTIGGGCACPGTAGVLAARAQGLALAGRGTEATTAVNAVEEMTDRMPAEALADESPFGWPEHRLRHTESFVYTEIGNTSRAMVAQDRALELYPADHTTNRSLVQMHRASCLIREGHVGDGLRYAADVLDGLPKDRHDHLLNEMARRVLAAVPDRDRRRSEANDLQERIDAPATRG